MRYGHIADLSWSVVLFMGQIPTEVKIALRFKAYRKEMYSAWRGLSLIRFYAPYLRDAVKSDDFPPFQLKQVPTGQAWTSSKNRTYGTILNLSNTILRSTLLETVSCFEYFHSDLCRYVLLDYPLKLNEKNSKEDDARREKLLEIILQSS